MDKPESPVIGTEYELNKNVDGLEKGQRVTLETDDGSSCPYFEVNKNGETACIFWEHLDPVEGKRPHRITMGGAIRAVLYANLADEDKLLTLRRIAECEE